MRKEDLTNIRSTVYANGEKIESKQRVNEQMSFRRLIGRKNSPRDNKGEKNLFKATTAMKL